MSWKVVVEKEFCGYRVDWDKASVGGELYVVFPQCTADDSDPEAFRMCSEKNCPRKLSKEGA